MSLFFFVSYKRNSGRECAASESIEQGRGYHLQKIHFKFMENHLLFLYDMVYIVIS